MTQISATQVDGVRTETHRPDFTIAFPDLAAMVAEALALHECGRVEDSVAVLRNARRYIRSLNPVGYEEEP